MNNDRNLLSLIEMSAQLGVHPNTLRKMNKKGLVPSYRIGTHPSAKLRFDPVEVRAAIRTLRES